MVFIYVTIFLDKWWLWRTRFFSYNLSVKLFLYFDNFTINASCHKCIVPCFKTVMCKWPHGPEYMAFLLQIDWSLSLLEMNNQWPYWTRITDKWNWIIERAIPICTSTKAFMVWSTGIDFPPTSDRWGVCSSSCVHLTNNNRSIYTSELQ